MNFFQLFKFLEERIIIRLLLVTLLEVCTLLHKKIFAIYKNNIYLYFERTKRNNNIVGKLLKGKRDTIKRGKTRNFNHFLPCSQVSYNYSLWQWFILSKLLFVLTLFPSLHARLWFINSLNLLFIKVHSFYANVTSNNSQ